ncbi:MAG: hypothetical protein GX575_03655 [Candidatus Anammoximicrobium sp.]|nr:hypothetical protein [Candidatus Anammoximicrobium sp.]
MKSILAIAWLSILILVSVAGCGGNTVELPRDPDPMPAGPPRAAGEPAPSGQAAAAKEQPAQAAPQ